MSIWKWIVDQWNKIKESCTTTPIEVGQRYTDQEYNDNPFVTLHQYREVITDVQDKHVRFDRTTYVKRFGSDQYEQEGETKRGLSSPERNYLESRLNVFDWKRLED